MRRWAELGTGYVVRAFVNGDVDPNNPALYVEVTQRTPMPQVGWVYDPNTNTFNATSVPGATNAPNSVVDWWGFRCLFTIEELRLIYAGSVGTTGAATRTYVAWAHLDRAERLDLTDSRVQEILTLFVTMNYLTAARKLTISSGIRP